MELLEAIHAKLPSATGAISSSGTSGSASRWSSTGTRLRISRRSGRDVPHVEVSSSATTWSPSSQNAMNSRSPDRASEDDAVPAVGEARVLHADVVLVGEEVRHPVVRLRPDRASRGRRRPLLERVAPVLDPHPLAVERVPGAGDVARREHARRVRAQPLVDQDRRRPRPARRWRPARGAAGRRRPRRPRRSRWPSRRSGARARPRLRPRMPPRPRPAATARRGRRARRGRSRRPRRRARPRSGNRLRLDDGHLQAARAGGRCHLAADPAAPDHHHVPARVQSRAQRVRVAELAQVRRRPCSARCTGSRRGSAPVASSRAS